MSTITGSIGVILGSVNATAMMEKVGLSNQTFKSGPFKDTLSMTRMMRPDEKVYIQSLVQETYDKFVGIVAESRELSIGVLQNGIADGRIFNGSKAKEVGLIDNTGYVEDALQVLKNRAGIEKAETIYYEDTPTLVDLLGMLSVTAQKDTKIELDWGQGQFTRQMKPFVPYMVLEGY